MSGRYAPLSNAGDEEPSHEMEAAFDDSDDEGEDATESQPLNPGPRSPVRVPGTYDFENLDYDYPPPGSPPPPSTTAFPNSWGNSNGTIPSFDAAAPAAPRRNWFERSAGAILPTHFAQRLGVRPGPPQGIVGGGTHNDGVFANVTAKPTASVRAGVDGDDNFIIPEDTRPEAPPSYAHAQADAVPPYWETTVHAPFSPESMGDMIIDALPTGSLFSFLWNMLVSISFQFVGFLLTYLLHTSHASRLGSRAGLGVTLIQYGFALKGQMDSPSKEDPWSWTDGQSPRPSGNGTATPASLYHLSMMNNSTLADEQAAMLVADATTEWLSFFLMTVGWFVLLTSLLGFWRVKRWERGIIASQATAAPASAQPEAQDAPSQFERIFRIHGVAPGELFRHGFGLGSSRETDASRAEEGALSPNTAAESEFMIHISPDSPQRARLIREALVNERRLQNDLRAAGLL